MHHDSSPQVLPPFLSKLGAIKHQRLACHGAWWHSCTSLYSILVSSPESGCSTIEHAYTDQLGCIEGFCAHCMQSVEGVPRIAEGLNPATWMLEVTTPGMEDKLGISFAEQYANSHLAKSVLYLPPPSTPTRPHKLPRQASTALLISSTSRADSKYICNLYVLSSARPSQGCVWILKICILSSLQKMASLHHHVAELKWGPIVRIM